jgi:hypothetical protein
VIAVGWIYTVRTTARHLHSFLSGWRSLNLFNQNSDYRLSTVFSFLIQGLNYRCAATYCVSSPQPALSVNLDMLPDSLGNGGKCSRSHTRLLTGARAILPTSGELPVLRPAKALSASLASQVHPFLLVHLFMSLEVAIRTEQLKSFWVGSHFSQGGPVPFLGRVDMMELQGSQRFVVAALLAATSKLLDQFLLILISLDRMVQEILLYSLDIRNTVRIIEE